MTITPTTTSPTRVRLARGGPRYRWVPRVVLGGLPVLFLFLIAYAYLTT